MNGVGGTWFPLANVKDEDDEDDDNMHTRTRRGSSSINEEQFERDFIQSRKESKQQQRQLLDQQHQQQSQQNSQQTPLNKAQALEFGKGYQPGKEGLLIKGYGNGNDGEINSDHDHSNNNDNNNPHVIHINKGDAIAFYNYKNDGSGQLDWKALHTGLPTTEEDGVKWIANHWFRVGKLCDY